MSVDARLDRLVPALSARERGILMLKSLKGELDEDPLWRTTMPREQHADFNRYIALMNTANVHLAHLVTFIEKEVEKLELRLAFVIALRMSEAHLAAVSFATSIVAREPITATEHARLLEQTAAEYIPVGAAASRLAELQRAWSDDDLEDSPLLGEKLIKDEAWERLCGEAERDLRTAIARGELDSKGSGKGLRVRHGSFDAWLGRRPTAYPESADAYEVRPDEEASLVELDRRTLLNLKSRLEQGPFAGLPIPEGGLTETLEEQVRRSVAMRWKDIRTAEIALEEIAREFAGTDALKPATRAALDVSKETLLNVLQYFECYGPEVELEEPNEADLALVREFVERGRRLFS